MSETAPTRVCLLTAPGRSAVAVVAVTGPSCMEAVERFFRAANKKSLVEQAVNRVVYGHWREEDLIVCRPVQDEVEIHCHGGSQSSTQIIADLEDAGCQRVESEAWAAEHSASSIEAEGLLALASAATERAARYLLRQQQGALQRAIEAIVAGLQQTQVDAASEKTAALLRWKQFGLHLTKPWRVVIAGRPNVGKSSLINAIAGYQRAIVYDQPGTTRDVVSVVTALDGWPVELSDTAGLRRTNDTLEAAGVERAQREITETDLLLWMLDATTLAEESAASLAERQAEQVGVSLKERPHLIVANKIDLAPLSHPLQGETLAVSATQGMGLPELIAAVAAQLVPTVPGAEEAIPFTTRQISALETLQVHCKQGRIAEALNSCRQLLCK